MTWARKRQIIAVLILLIVFGGITAGITAYVLHTPASCIDKKQNQDETGTDCGGVCTTVCRSATVPARVRFARVIQKLNGQVDMIAYIDNPNANAEARDARVDLEIYGAESIPLSRGVLPVNLPAKSTVPVFIANIGSSDIQRVFLSFASGTPVWTKPAREILSPQLRDIALAGTSDNPKVTATLVNTVAQARSNITIIATVFNESGNAIAATQTFVPSLAPQGSAPLIFNFGTPFTENPTRIEVLPVPQL